MFVNAIRKLFGLEAKPSMKDVAKYAESLTESQARELLGTSHMAGDGTDSALVRYAAGYAMAKAAAEGRLVELVILSKYRGKEPEEVFGLIGDDEVEELLAYAKAEKMSDSADPSGREERKKLALMVFGVLRLMSPYN